MDHSTGHTDDNILNDSIPHVSRPRPKYKGSGGQININVERENVKGWLKQHQVAAVSVLCQQLTRVSGLLSFGPGP